MQINITDPIFQTALFTVFLIAFTILTAKKDTGPHEMNQAHTNELKGVAILMVIFSHVGYFLFSDHKFLYPLSTMGGVGVNIFLFLSGFGLTSSELMSKKTIIQFYKRRLKSIYPTMWVVFILTLALDYLLLHKTYELPVVIQSFLGFFPIADIFTSINSPLWYFTLILFYYLTFPLLFRRKRPIWSIGIILLLGVFMTKLNLPVSQDVLKLYQLHYLAFPLGMVFAYFNTKQPGVALEKKFSGLPLSYLTLNYIRYFLISLIFLIVGYTAIHSGIGDSVLTEQLISMITVLTILVIFLLKNIQSNLLITLGKYSYEIYLIQWPIMYRFDFIYKYTPAFLGTLLYIVVFIVLGFGLNKLVKFIMHRT